MLFWVFRCSFFRTLAWNTWKSTFLETFTRIANFDKTFLLPTDRSTTFSAIVLRRSLKRGKLAWTLIHWLNSLRISRNVRTILSLVSSITCWHFVLPLNIYTFNCWGSVMRYVLCCWWTVLVKGRSVCRTIIIVSIILSISSCWLLFASNCLQARLILSSLYRWNIMTRKILPTGQLFWRLNSDIFFNRRKRIGSDFRIAILRGSQLVFR